MARPLQVFPKKYIFILMRLSAYSVVRTCLSCKKELTTVLWLRWGRTPALFQSPLPTSLSFPWGKPRTYRKEATLFAGQQLQITMDAQLSAILALMSAFLAP